MPAEPKIKVLCQLCDEVIAIIDLRTIKYPLTADMFKSHDADHGLPDPFYPGADWEFFKCPYGQHRPMSLPDHVRTELGMLFLPADGSTPFFTETQDDRSYILDRGTLNPLPVMSDEQAEAQARRENTIERKEHVQAEEQQGQQADQKPIEAKEETNTKRNTKPNLKCFQCDKSFKNRSGLLNHSRLVHKITDVEVIDRG